MPSVEKWRMKYELSNYDIDYSFTVRLTLVALFRRRV